MKLKWENFIGWLSLPFTLGVLIGLAILGKICIPSWARLTICAATLPVIILWTMASRPGGFRWRTAGQGFLLGISCALLHSMLPSLDLEGWLERLAAGCCSRLKNLIASLDLAHSESAALLTALLTGDRSGLSRELVQTFRTGGASHILALSGLHLGIICIVISKSLSLLGRSPAARYVRAFTTVGLCWFYCLMTGAGPSLVRALLFVCIGELAGLNARRRVNGVRTLLCALMIQLAIRPESALQAGFQLSYLATTGIALCFPVLRNLFPVLRNLFPVLRGLYAARPLKRVWDMAALTLSCQIFTAPWCYVLFRTLPRHFLLTNLIAIPLTTLAVGTGVIALTLSAIGLCPHFLVLTLDALLNALLSAMAIIARM
ncbi:MAG: ComEC/Rec2 family competence protein [Bacteroidales bacterium]|nr:ComEC/Rec2 family competence protein [Bacteroidales bacterium]